MTTTASALPAPLVADAIDATANVLLTRSEVPAHLVRRLANDTVRAFIALGWRPPAGWEWGVRDTNGDNWAETTEAAARGYVDLADGGFSLIRRPVGDWQDAPERAG